MDLSGRQSKTHSWLSPISAVLILLAPHRTGIKFLKWSEFLMLAGSGRKPFRMDGHPEFD